MKKLLLTTALLGSFALGACSPCDNLQDINSWPAKSPGAYCLGKHEHAKTASPQKAVSSVPAQKTAQQKTQPLYSPEETAALESMRARNAVPLAIGTSITLDSYTFDPNSSYLGRAGKAYLSEKADELKAIKYNRLIVTGHTDSTGDAAVNQRLSEKRAKTVGDYLIDEGVPANKIVTVGKGSSEPIASNATAEGRKTNRRVNIAVE